MGVRSPSEAVLLRVSVPRGSIVILSCAITAESLVLQYTDGKLLASAIYRCSLLRDRWHLQLQEISDLKLRIHLFTQHATCNASPIGYHHTCKNWQSVCHVVNVVWQQWWHGEVIWGKPGAMGLIIAPWLEQRNAATWLKTDIGL